MREHGSAGEPVRGDGQHVLVADDPGTVELLSTTLRLAGYRVAGEGTAAGALARLAEDRADLVVLDAALPDLAGLGRYSRVPAAERPGGCGAARGPSS